MLLPGGLRSLEASLSASARMPNGHWGLLPDDPQWARLLGSDIALLLRILR
jgi:hypothetical protein